MNEIGIHMDYIQSPCHRDFKICTKFTLRISGDKLLGPRDEKRAILTDKGFPTRVFEGLNFTIGFLHSRLSFMNELIYNERTFFFKFSGVGSLTLKSECRRAVVLQRRNQLQCMANRHRD